MRHETILKREDGTQVKITADICIESYYRPTQPEWSIVIEYKLKGKKLWNSIVDYKDFSYRKMSQEDRIAYVASKKLEYVTKEEILQAKIELWEKLKPTE